jgi:hypothetical protein
MNKKTIYIIVAVLIVIIVVAVAAYAVYYKGGSGTTSPTPTPTAAPTTIVGATTLQFSVNETTKGQLVTYQYAFENLSWSGTTVQETNALIRLDIPGGSSGNYSYIFNPHSEQSWSSTDNGMTWTAGHFATDWPQWSPLFNDYMTHLVSSWNGGATYSYTATSGSANVIYDIKVNPTLSATFFATS